MTEDRTQKTLTAIWRMEAARIIGGIARMVRDVSLAEDLAQEAMVSALLHWRNEESLRRLSWLAERRG